MSRIYQVILNWIQYIRPWVNKMLENYPYMPLILIVIVWIIAALVQRHKKRATIQTKKKSKKNPAPKGGYTNFKGEVWYPDGRKWNQDTKKWETSDYQEDPTKQT